jgi:hypothetical protein
MKTAAKPRGGAGIFLLAAFLACFAAAGVFAEEKKTEESQPKDSKEEKKEGPKEIKGWWGVYAGYYVPEEGFLDAGLTFGARAAYDLGDISGVEATVGHYRDGGESGGVDYRFTDWFADFSMTWSFPARKNFSVMPLMGIGYAEIKTTVGGQSESQGGMTFHAGLAGKYKFDKDGRYYIRPEIRMRQYEKMDVLDWEATVGIGFRFSTAAGG